MFLMNLSMIQDLPTAASPMTIILYRYGGSFSWIILIFYGFVSRWFIYIIISDHYSISKFLKVIIQRGSRALQAQIYQLVHLGHQLHNKGKQFTSWSDKFSMNLSMNTFISNLSKHGKSLSCFITCIIYKNYGTCFFNAEKPLKTLFLKYTNISECLPSMRSTYSCD